MHKNENNNKDKINIEVNQSPSQNTVNSAKKNTRRQSVDIYEDVSSKEKSEKASDSVKPKA